MSDSSQLLRQWKMIQRLAESKVGLTTAELTDEFEMSERNIRRDLRLIKVAGFHVEETVDDDRRKRWKMKPLAEQINFNIEELLSICVARRFFEPLAGTPFWTGLNRVYRRIHSALGESAVRYLQRLAGTLHTTAVGSSDYSHRGELIDQLMVAIEDRRVSLIVYRSEQATEPVEQEVYPQGFVFHRSSLYLIAWSSRRSEIRNYKMDRIESVTSTTLRAVVPEKFSIEDWLEHSFGVFRSGNTQLHTIRVRFDRSVARYMQESQWHRHQSLTTDIDGSVTATFRLSDTQEIKHWIMSFGPAAVVLEPPELAEEIQADLTQMLAAYERNRV